MHGTAACTALHAHTAHCAQHSLLVSLSALLPLTAFTTSTCSLNSSSNNIVILLSGSGQQYALPVVHSTDLVGYEPHACFALLIMSSDWPHTENVCTLIAIAAHSYWRALFLKHRPQQSLSRITCRLCTGPSVYDLDRLLLGIVAWHALERVQATQIRSHHVRPLRECCEHSAASFRHSFRFSLVCHVVLACWLEDSRT